MTAPASLSSLTRCASSDGFLPLCIRDPFSVGISFVSMISFMPIGRPFNIPGVFSFHLLSACLACSSASSGSKKIQAPTSDSRAFMCSKKALTYSSEVSSPLFIISNALTALIFIRFIIIT